MATDAPGKNAGGEGRGGAPGVDVVVDDDLCARRTLTMMPHTLAATARTKTAAVKKAPLHQRGGGARLTTAAGSSLGVRTTTEAMSRKRMDTRVRT